MLDRRLRNIFVELGLAARSGTFREHAVHVKLAMPDGRAVFIDDQGGLYSNGETGQLSRESLTKIQLIHSMSNCKNSVLMGKYCMKPNIWRSLLVYAQCAKNKEMTCD